jgi:putative nucleotidyltransferase with HDIG domain
MQQKGSILFVDSDTNQLESLQRSLREMREHWQMHFAEDAESALALMQQQPVDILVSETRLDGGTGSALLMQAQKRHPLTTRLLFSGQAMREPAQEIVHHAHQFIAKPCSVESLISILQRVMQLRGLLQNTAMREMINSLGTLPSLPETYFRMIEALRSEITTVQQIGKMVEQDLAMSAKVLQMVNSAFFGLRQRIASPVHAVSLLGIETVTSLALTAGLFSQLKQSLVESFDLQSLWQHSMNVAGLTRELCSQLGLPREQSEVPVLAGMLHDIGKLVLVTADTEEYRRIYDLAKQQDLPLHLVESQSLWADHAAVGAYLMGLWGLPFAAVEAVALHHKPELLQRDASHCVMVYAANLLLHHLSDQEHASHYTTDRLESLLGKEDAARWLTIAQEYLDGKAS